MAFLGVCIVGALILMIALSSIANLVVIVGNALTLVH
jgi:hypothetical protein